MTVKLHADEIQDVCTKMREQGVPEVVIRQYRESFFETSPLDTLGNELGIPLKGVSQIGRDDSAQIVLNLQDGSQVNLGTVHDLHNFRHVKERLFATHGIVLNRALGKVWDSMLSAIAKVKEVVDCPDPYRDLILKMLSDLWHQEAVQVQGEITGGAQTINLDDERYAAANALTEREAWGGGRAVRDSSGRLTLSLTSLVKRAGIEESSQLSRRYLAQELSKIGFQPLRLSLTCSVRERIQVRVWSSPAHFDRVLDRL